MTSGRPTRRPACRPSANSTGPRRAARERRRSPRRSRRCAERASAGCSIDGVPSPSTTSIRRRCAIEPMLQVVVDRVQISGEDLRQRLTDSIETAYLEGGGAAWADQSWRVGQERRMTAMLRPVFTCSPSASSAGSAASRTRIRSRGCSRSTTRSARARPATASATSSSSTWIWSCPIQAKSIQEGAIEPWSKPHYRAQLAELKRAAKKAQDSARRAVGRSHRRARSASSSRATATRTRASAASSAGSSGRNTRSTSACS